MIALSHFCFFVFECFQMSNAQVQKFVDLECTFVPWGKSWFFVLPSSLPSLLFFFFVFSTFPTIGHLGGEMHSFDSSLLFLALFTFL